MRAKAGLAVLATLAVVVHCGSRSGLIDDTQGTGIGLPPPGEPDSSFDPDAPDSPVPDDGGDGGVGDPPDVRLPDGAVPDGCGDTRSSPQNCGACGHDCQGGTCSQGVCQPFLLTSNELFPTTLAVDDQNVYWGNVTDVDYGSPPAAILVKSMPKTGGKPKTLDTFDSGYATSLHVDGNNLYFYRSIEWASKGQNYEGTIVRLCKDGSCPRASLAGSIDNSKWEIAIDATRIFFPLTFAGSLAQIPKGGGPPVGMQILPAFYFPRLTIDDLYVYAIAVPNDTIVATTPVMLVRSAKAVGSPLVPLMKGLVEDGDIHVDANNIYVSNTKVIYRLPKTGTGALQPTPMDTKGGIPGLFTLDTDRIYWLEYSDPSAGTRSSLHWMGKDGKGLGSMALPNDATKGPGLVIDDKSLYWVTTLAGLNPPAPPRGGIMKVAKPL